LLSARGNRPLDDPLRHRQRPLRRHRNWYLSRDEAEATLVSIFWDEPDFEGELWVAAVDFEVVLN
jgi:hypothetical protein